MNIDWLERTQLLVGKEGVRKLQQSSVLVVGLGGVGAYAAELVCRGGVGQMTIIDTDTVNISNINRQIPALTSTVGQHKIDVMSKRLLDINPNLKLQANKVFINEKNVIGFLQAQQHDYIIDAIDTLMPKIFLVFRALQLGIPLVSSMGAGGKIDPTQVQIVDIKKTYNCKLARMLRKKLHQLDVYEGFDAVFSPEDVSKKHTIAVENEANKKTTVGTVSYMPPIFGCYCASVVLRNLIKA